MKTEQEQIEAMTSIIVEILQDKRAENGTTFATYIPSLFGNNPDKEKEIVEALIENGYGDVSEYKAEIERLKDDYAKLQEQFAQYQMASDKEIMAQRKQAKIDVLNELKKYLHTEDFDTPDERWKPESEFCAIIDELIKEIENGKDKG